MADCIYNLPEMYWKKMYVTSCWVMQVCIQKTEEIFAKYAVDANQWGYDSQAKSMQGPGAQLPAILLAKWISMDRKILKLKKGSNLHERCGMW